ncbi:ATP-binding Cassette (ABC) superfamily [Thraustotheca clavata]|uniref:ATP-binding Cassette (ABC) superfamily n=1 Tax=Thraustotheca clavata TaxID=74557 RepID=A0A1W0A602_9STRA|nr:ATP-binding Cassette (ABC) superfamily [Thraustotheca clavata]
MASTKVIGACALIACALVIGILWHLSSTSYFSDVFQWLQTHPTSGGFIYMVIYAITIVFCLPATVFEMIAGYIFGMWWGWAIAIVGKTTGSCISFVFGRYFFHARVLRLLESGPPIFRALGILLNRPDLKWKIVCLTRIAWMPIAIKNYGLSVLPVSFRMFFWSTLLLGTPFGGVSCYIGHTATHVNSIVSGSHESKSHLQFVLMAVGGGSALTLFCLVGYYTRKYIEQLAEKDLEMTTTKHEYIPIRSDEQPDDQV